MPLWRQQLTKSLHQTRNTPESRYFQLATCDANGLPQCRTVVYRGITDGHALEVISDTRTSKYQEISQQQGVQVCWYFAKTREQYRFTAKADIITTDEDARRVASHWQKLSDAGKKQFLWGEPDTRRDPTLPLLAEGDFNEVPAHFCLLNLTVKAVDYLSLRGNPQIREKHIKDASGEWVVNSVVP
ncbi:pyridoxamine 5'-phosphate oxidase family protein [Alteromonas sp. H39]|uniref:pyridoxamine 5'-phosphate oxidase family protein n=1 Tax=Alteromonas sp. H39 TaxID=3389876 RepID=UPI0039E15FC9